jgi:hypothetical protein
LGNAGDIAGPSGFIEPEDTPLIAARNREALANARLRIQEVQIQNQVNAGLISGADAQRAFTAAQAASRDEIIKTLEAQRNSVDANSLEGLQLTAQIEQMRMLGVELNNNQRFMRGFNSQIESVGDAFERFGSNVAHAFTNVRDLFNGLKQAVLSFFNDLIGNSLQNLVRGTLGSLFGGGGGGALGNLFRTPSFAGGGGGGGFGGIAQAFAGALGGGISAPASVSNSAISTLPGAGTFGGVLPRPNPGFTQAISSAAFGGAGSAASKFSLSGFGQSLAGAAPLLGLGLGGSLGGQSLAGNILGSAGGFLGGAFLAATVTPGIFSAGAAALFSNPITAIAGAGLLVGSILLGKASQRHKDEEASGQMLKQAYDALGQLKASIASDAIDGAQARAIFESQILNNFISQINTLKTKSVRESRLKNQVNDLRAAYEAIITPEVAAQAQRRSNAQRFSAIDSRLVPQFASGGVVPGQDRGFDSVRAVLRPGEMVLNMQQQASIRAIAGAGIFDRAGVPGINRSGRFDTGGIAPWNSNSSGQGTVVIDRLFINVDAEGIAIAGMSGPGGEQIVINHIENVRLRKGRK